MMAAPAVVQQSDLRLNLGCGRDIRNGYVNADIVPGSGVLRADLTSYPWPWPDSSVAEVLLHHVLEHLPNTPQVMKEIYRVCRDGAMVHIAVPHPRHDDFLSDPTHVSPITQRTMWLFSKKLNEATANDANTPMALILGVDFELVRECFVVEKRWMERVENGQITEDDLRDAILTCNNVVKQIEMSLKVLKP